MNFHQNGEEILCKCIGKNKGNFANINDENDDVFCLQDLEGFNKTTIRQRAMNNIEQITQVKQQRKSLKCHGVSCIPLFACRSSTHFFNSHEILSKHFFILFQFCC